jgi:hypothetical protein
VGWLIMEDIFTVIILIFLPALVGDTDGQGLLASLADDQVLIIVLSLAQALLFVVLMLLAGTRIIPWLLREVVRAGSRSEPPSRWAHSWQAWYSTNLTSASVPDSKPCPCATRSPSSSSSLSVCCSSPPS